jgi:hypothetical protein
MLLGNAAERPQRILQALGQRDEALAAQDNVSMLETRECQSEVMTPSWASEMANLTRRRPRRASLRQSFVQKVSPPMLGYPSKALRAGRLC